MKKTSCTTKAVRFILICIALVFVATFCGCSSGTDSNNSSSSVNSSISGGNVEQKGKYLVSVPGGYVVGPVGASCTIQDPFQVTTYTILSPSQFDFEEFNKKSQENIKIVKEWWGDDSTFVEPTIIPVTFSTGFSGLAKDGFIFVSPSYPDSFVTLVHETIHAQNDMGLNDLDNNGYKITEMVVEDITLRIMGDRFVGTTTREQKFFAACPKLVAHRAWLEESFKKGRSTEETYKPIFGDDWKKKTQLLNSWDKLPNLFNSQTDYEIFLENTLGITDSELWDLYDKLHLMG